MTTVAGVHHLQTPGGVVSAKRVVFCTGGYTGGRMHASVKNKIMPILSKSVATRPLTDAKMAAGNFKDTRALHFYYRLLDGNRLQLGSRSSITGADAQDHVHLRLLTDAIAHEFPPLAGIQIDHSWWGWVDVSHDMMPCITKPKPDPKLNVWYAVGYGGNGASFTTWAGKRVACKDGDQAVFDLPNYNSSLEFPNAFNMVRSAAFAPFRRFGQFFLYKWYWLNDEKM